MRGLVAAVAVALGLLATVPPIVHGSCPTDEPCASVRLDPDHGPPGTVITVIDPEGILESAGWTPVEVEPCIYFVRPGKTLGDYPAGVEATEDSDAAFIGGHWIFGSPDDQKPQRYVIWANLVSDGGVCFANGFGPPNAGYNTVVLGEFVMTPMLDTATAPAAPSGGTGLKPSFGWVFVVSLLASLLWLAPKPTRRGR